VALAACQGDDDGGADAGTDAGAGATDTVVADTTLAPGAGAVSTPGGSGAPGATGTTTSTTVAPGPVGPDCASLPLDEAADLTLAELVGGAPLLSDAAEAWAAAGLLDRLGGTGPITIVVPTDAAFAALDDATWDRLESDPSGALARVLELHVVDGDRPLADLVTTGALIGAAGTLTATEVDGDVLLDAGGGPGVVTCADVEVANGRIHVVDAVLLPPPVDTEAVGGSQLYRVDPATGAATSVGGFGAELGVLDVVAIADDTLLALTDAAELLTFAPATADAPSTRLPITGVEGTTLLALDQLTDGSLLAVSDLSRLYRIDPATAAATPVGPALEPGIDDLGVGIDAGPEGSVRLVVATGLDVTIEPASGTVVAAGPPPQFGPEDVNAGAPPRIVAIASVGDELVALDATTSALARLGPDGILSTLGPVGVTLTDGAGLDATPSGTLYLTVPG
jgi:uncharacterized surface protein with fasciclin (FAS1) repeats